MKQVTSANLIPLCILRILEKYTDAQSRLDIKDFKAFIEDRLEVLTMTIQKML